MLSLWALVQARVSLERQRASERAPCWQQFLGASETFDDRPKNISSLAVCIGVRGCGCSGHRTGHQYTHCQDIAVEKECRPHSECRRGVAGRGRAGPPSYQGRLPVRNFGVVSSRTPLLMSLLPRRCVLLPCIPQPANVCACDVVAFAPPVCARCCP